jgi:hypothetical protein
LARLRSAKPPATSIWLRLESLGLDRSFLQIVPERAERRSA